MPVALKILLVLCCLWPTLSCAAENYGENPAALALVDELVEEENFDREQLLQVFAQAVKDEVRRRIASFACLDHRRHPAARMTFRQKI